MKKIKICIFASELAASLDKNPYNPQNQAIKKIYNRHNNISEMCEAEKILSQQNFQFSEVSNQSDQTIVNPDQIVAYSNQIINQTLNTNNLDNNQKNIVSDYIKSHYYANYGNNREKDICQQYESSHHVMVKKDDIFRKKIIYQNDKYEIYIGGKCDGVVKDEYLIEIKNRIYKLHGEVKEYEKIQILSYLYIWNLKSAKLIENYFQDSLEYTIIFDSDNFQDLIKHNIEKFISIYELLAP